MSGGSYNYLHLAYSLPEMVNKRLELIEMHRRMRGMREEDYPGIEKATTETLELIDALAEAEAAVHKASMSVRDVWHAIEWLDSCDGDDDQVVDALKPFTDS
jgi:hypothetical protein